MNKVIKFAYVFDKVAGSYLGQPVVVSNKEHAERTFADAIRGTPVVNHANDYVVHIADVPKELFKPSFEIATIVGNLESKDIKSNE